MKVGLFALSYYTMEKGGRIRNMFEKPRRRPNSFFSKKLLLGQTIYSDYKEINLFTKDRTLMD